MTTNIELKIILLAFLSCMGAQIAKFSALQYTPDEVSAIMMPVIVISIIVGNKILNYK